MLPSPALSDLISPEYLAEQERLHADPRGYGGRGSKWAEVVANLITEQSASMVVDYGCGQATLRPAVEKLRPRDGMTIHWWDYDPARSEFALPPPYAHDLVVCTDVLEHVELEKLASVLHHLRACTRKDGWLFTVISTVPTDKKLSDGRQAHITLLPWDEWVARIEAAGFRIVDTAFPNPKPEKQIVALWEAI